MRPQSELGSKLGLERGLARGNGAAAGRGLDSTKAGTTGLVDTLGDSGAAALTATAGGSVAGAIAVMAGGGLDATAVTATAREAGVAPRGTAGAEARGGGARST